MEAKFETQEKQRKSQEKRIQARNKEVRELKQKLECNDLELEADHDLIENAAHQQEGASREDRHPN
jgi:hypothetical protein